MGEVNFKKKRDISRKSEIIRGKTMKDIETMNEPFAFSLFVQSSLSFFVFLLLVILLV